jgi:hypothetical protein
VVTRRTYTDEQLAEAVRTSRNMREILTKLGLVPQGGNYETVRRRLRDLGIDQGVRRIRKGRPVRDCTDEEIRAAVAASRSLAQTLDALGIRRGGNQSRLRERIRGMGLDVSHLAGQGWRKGSRSPVRPPTPLSELLVDGRLGKTDRLKRRLIAEGVKVRECEICRLDRWNGRPIPLELDHVNGRRDDNRLANLRIVCPNCHAQTQTYRGRNIGAGVPYSDSSPGGANRQPHRT